MKSLIYFCITCMVLIALSACNGQPSPALSPVSISPLSVPVTRNPSPALPTATVPKLSDPALGGVKGRIVSRSTNQPAGGFSLYLGDQLPIQPGNQHAITFQEKSSPHVDVDGQGNFAIVNAKPGTYALILWTPLKSLVVADPGQPDKELSVTVKAGEITDLGDVVSDTP